MYLDKARLVGHGVLRCKAQPRRYQLSAINYQLSTISYRCVPCPRAGSEPAASASSFVSSSSSLTPTPNINHQSAVIFHLLFILLENGASRISRSHPCPFPQNIFFVIIMAIIQQQPLMHDLTLIFAAADHDQRHAR